jgi:hypothetical protein
MRLDYLKLRPLIELSSALLDVPDYDPIEQVGRLEGMQDAATAAIEGNVLLQAALREVRGYQDIPTGDPETALRCVIDSGIETMFPLVVETALQIAGPEHKHEALLEVAVAICATVLEYLAPHAERHAHELQPLERARLRTVMVSRAAFIASFLIDEWLFADTIASEAIAKAGA